MDAFESIRRTASDLHARLVAAGVNALDPDALVRAAAKSLDDLAISTLPAGDPGLKGARALLDEQSGMILCERSGTATDRAILIAHEIGHVCLHLGSATCSEADVDASRSTESAAVGLQRVENYGVRERRELQANVFAREFLLPRDLARSLYLDKKLSAEDIVAKTGLPVPLVRQQLFDALLLPRFEDEPARPQAELIPDPIQDSAAKHRGTPYQLQAGPGTGKTRTLIKRIVSLVDDDKVPPEAILVLTFSNRAAGELSERLSLALPDAAPKIWAGTFHSFGLELLRRHGELIGLPKDPALFDRSDAIEVLEEILPTMGLTHYRNLWDPSLALRDVLTGISRAKDEMVDYAAYAELAKRMWANAGNDEDRKTAATRCLEVAQIYERYERAKADARAVDFGDLIMQATLLLEHHPKVAEATRLRHRHVLVDEYQDVNRASVRLLKALTGDDTKRLWVVGDARQAIYRFRGASSGNMVAFATDFPGSKSEALGRSYRSTESIISGFQAFSRSMEASDGLIPLDLQTDHGKGFPVELRTFQSLDDEVAGLAASIETMKDDGLPYRDQAILCRTNRRLSEIAAGLEARGIPILHLGSLFERDEIRDLLTLLSLAVDRRGAGLARVAALPRYGIPMQDIHHALQFLRDRDQPPLEGLRALPAEQSLSDEGRQGLAKLAADLHGFGRGDTAWNFLGTYLLDRSDSLRAMAAGTGVSDWMRSVAVWQLLNFLRDEAPTGGGAPIWRSLERIRQLVLLAEERDLRQVPAPALQMNAVRLMTIHGSKGLEFEAVHLPGMTEVSIPSSYRAPRCPPPEGMVADDGNLSVDQAARRSHKTEEECLFFVAMSRARSHLRLYQSRTQPNGKNRDSSSYLPKLPNLARIGAPALMPGGAADSSKVPIVLPPDYAATDSELRNFKSCPRRFFYTHILGLGGGRRPTAFTQTHDALYGLIDWLREVSPAGIPSLDDVERRFEEIWQDTEVAAKPAAAQYRDLASRMIASLVKASANRSFRERTTLALNLREGRVIVEPDSIAQLQDGTVILRRLRTGHRRSKEYEDTAHIEYGLYIHAARQAYGPTARVEAVHLTDDIVEIVPMKDDIVRKRVADADQVLGKIRSGQFPTDPDPTRCARCPHFFVCAAVPAGQLVVADG